MYTNIPIPRGLLSVTRLGRKGVWNKSSPLQSRAAVWRQKEIIPSSSITPLCTEGLALLTHAAAGNTLQKRAVSSSSPSWIGSWLGVVSGAKPSSGNAGTGC